MRPPPDIRLSCPTLRVLKQLLQRPRHPQSGAELSLGANVGSGTLYPMLARLERAGWISGAWEAIDPKVAGRPRRKFYTLTALGYKAAAHELSALRLPDGALAPEGVST